ncbi:hypothetical protein [Burkholderia pseudomallei]|uniref:hypothetical protein n=1 Tax=Burkholderia pseudomallei TaxID=28450 RepID=UPI00097870D8|nr:hypothetical protein [Burkholderia pseudomallei]OMQ52651.1 hypothetical protein AQ709_01065 [Burkholderia pseudomallei]OMQ63108.1 hypothetical protein AQ711_11420 [Burkholderia pseudomallei]OMQ66310.1 hypothetical protein AQ712_10450 [Burkholderia pseudomallei]
MTDRELLELAAKANWHSEVEGGTVSFHYCDHEEAVVYIAGENQDHNGSDVELVWNPLSDDGEAFRLAVKLGILVSQQLSYVSVCQPHGNASMRGIQFQESYGTDSIAATRRAIVRAAAEIAKAREA